jgi:hypothetical protein
MTARCLVGEWGIDHVRDGHLKDFPPDYREALLDYIRLIVVPRIPATESVEKRGFSEDWNFKRPSVAAAHKLKYAVAFDGHFAARDFLRQLIRLL